MPNKHPATAASRADQAIVVPTQDLYEKIADCCVKSAAR
jgi:hypothetical protein